MSKYEISYEKENEILNTVKNIILKQYPILEDRLDILFNYPRPVMDINLNFYNCNDKNCTQIMFCVGTEIFKNSIPDNIEINGLISPKMVIDLISFILNDHDIISNISKTHNEINLTFKVDMRDENMCGMGCGQINLNLNFFGYKNHEELLKKYLNVIVNTFLDKLKNTVSFKREYNDYCLMIKEKVIDSLTEGNLHEFISLLNNEDLCNLLFNMPNDRFMEVYEDFKSQKKLIKDDKK